MKKIKQKKIPFIKEFKQTYGIGQKKIIGCFKNLGVNYNKYFFLKFFKQKITKLIKKNILNKLEKDKYLFLIKKNHTFMYKLRLYRAQRNYSGRPSRGQRTHTNAKTKKKFKIF